MDYNKLRTACKNVNEKFHTLGQTYWSYLPVYQIDSILVEAGFEATEPAIYCGRDGSIHEEVGNGKWLSMTWHKMESGRYEIVAYLN